jgi:spore germination cell wall hydrolase CwlJ-like protein
MNPQPYLSMNPPDLLKLATWREARGEGVLGKRGVTHSIMNRVALPRWWGTDIPSVVLCKNQFSSFNPGDPNGDKWPSDTDPSFVDCSEICDAVLAGTDDDITDGATNYYDISIPPPFWAASMQLTLAVGRFRFYR